MVDNAAIRAEVRGALARSPAFAALDDAARARLAADLEVVVTEVAPRAIADQVDLPAFVADLMAGVFAAQVETSVAQMRAYADLLAGAGRATQAPAATDADPKPARSDLTLAPRRVLGRKPPG
jgi:hypothetical protein